jgi:PAS domain S-box-containing protein
MDTNHNLPLMTWHARPDMSCEYVNEAWLRFTGYTLEQALGDGWYRCLHADDLARWLDAGVRAFDERCAFDIEYRMRRRDGVYRWILDRAEPRYGAGGEFLGFAGTCIELDARHAALAGLRVLVVGYDRETYEQLVRPLETAGADVRVAAGDSETLRTLDAWQPDVLLSEKHVIRALRGLPEAALLEAVARLAA